MLLTSLLSFYNRRRGSARRNTTRAMEQWKNKVAIVTGANSKIGAEICRQMCKHEIIVIGVTPQIDQLNALGEEIRENSEAAQFHAVQCDIGIEEEIQSAMEFVCGEFGGVDILVNNPAVLSSKLFLEEEGMDEAESMIKSNILGVMSFTKKAYKSMAERDVNGYVINVSCTIADHVSLNSIYAATKASVDTFTTCLGRELCVLVQPKIRVSNINPINVKKDLLEWSCSTEAETEEDPMQELFICPKDVADTVLYCLSTPAHVQIKDIHLGSVGGSF